MEEIWKEVVGYEGLYQVSNLGRVRSFKYKSPRILKHHNNKLGYARLILRKNNQSYGHSVHRLVAEAFIPNPNNLPVVNHKDENPRNNNVENLEWCTHQYNNVYGTKIDRFKQNTDFDRIAEKNSMSVLQYDLEGNLIKQWSSASECRKELGYDNSAIAKVCKGELGHAYGFMWRYFNGELIEKIKPYINTTKKPVQQYDLDGNLIEVWSGISEAERHYQLPNGCIYRCLVGKSKTSAGYQWKYLEVVRMDTETIRQWIKDDQVIKFYSSGV